MRLSALLKAAASAHGSGLRTFSKGRYVKDINPDKIAAELKNGVLTVHLPKTEAVKPRKIAIKGE